MSNPTNSFGGTSSVPPLHIYPLINLLSPPFRCITLTHDTRLDIHPCTITGSFHEVLSKVSDSTCISVHFESFGYSIFLSTLISVKRLLPWVEVYRIYVPLWLRTYSSVKKTKVSATEEWCSIGKSCRFLVSRHPEIQSSRATPGYEYVYVSFSPITEGTRYIFYWVPGPKL